MAIGKQPDVTADEADENGGDSIFAEINITPLTDVFLVMVVIFMVSALAVQAERNEEKRQEKEQKDKQQQDAASGLKLNLPEGKAVDIDTKAASLVLEIPLQGDVYIGGKAFTDDQLDNMFRAAFQKDKKTQVILRADRGVQHGRVVNIMERAKQTGLTHLAIGTGAAK
jgi:biopolymer transport protein ExbD